MAAKKNTEPAPRFKRKESEQLLISAFIDLLANHAISELDVDVIATKAGLKSGHVLVHRYFESRSGLVSATAHQISMQITEHISQGLASLTTITPLAVFTVIGETTDLTRRRALLISELMTTGANFELHAADNMRMITGIAQGFELIGMPPRIAHASAVKRASLMFMESIYSDWMGTSLQDANDVRDMTIVEMVHAVEHSQQLGWE